MRVIEPDLAIDDGDRPDGGEPASRAGDWSIFRRENSLARKSPAEKHGPVPFLAVHGRKPGRGRSASSATALAPAPPRRRD